MKEVHKGERYGRGTVLVGGDYRNKIKMRCDCGKEYETVIYSLINGHSQSCGCLKSDRVREANCANENHLALIPYADLMRKTHTSPARLKIGGRANRVSRTGIRGVYPNYNGGSGYMAKIGIHSHQINLGTFPTLEEAIAARRAAELKYWKPILDSLEGGDASATR